MELPVPRGFLSGNLGLLWASGLFSVVLSPLLLEPCPDAFGFGGKGGFALLPKLEASLLLNDPSSFA